MFSISRLQKKVKIRLIVFVVLVTLVSSCYNQTEEDPEYGLTLKYLLGTYKTSIVYEGKTITTTTIKDDNTNKTINFGAEKITIRALVTNSNHMVFAYSYDYENGTGMVDAYNTQKETELLARPPKSVTTNENNVVMTNFDYNFPEVYKIFEIFPRQEVPREEVIKYFMPANIMVRENNRGNIPDSTIDQSFLEFFSRIEKWTLHNSLYKVKLSTLLI